MSMQLALTVPCVSYLMKTGETNQDSLSKTRTLGSSCMDMSRGYEFLTDCPN